MKCCSLLLLLLLIFQIHANAQQNSFGIFGGVNYSTMRFEHNFMIEEESKYISDFVFGGNFTHSFNKTFAIRGEIILDKKGGDYCSNVVFPDGSTFGPSSFNSSVFTSRYTYSVEDHFTYIGVPLIFQISVGQRLNYIFHIGQSIAFQIHRNDTYGDDKLAKWNHSLLGGLGVSIPINNLISIQLNSRFTYGLSDLSSNEQMELRHMNYSGLIGIQYFIKGQ